MVSKWQFRDLLQAGAAQILQPDITHCGGITELKAISILGEAYYAAMMPHSREGIVGSVASMHVCASIPNFLAHELPSLQAAKGRPDVQRSYLGKSYITKPLNPMALLQLLAEQESPPPAQREAPQPPQPFDEAEQLELVAGNRALLEEMVRIYREDAPEMVGALEAAVAQRDGAAVVQHAHLLKGTLLNLAAGPAAKAAAEVEGLSRQGALDRVPVAVEALKSELVRLDRSLSGG